MDLNYMINIPLIPDSLFRIGLLTTNSLIATACMFMWLT